MARRRTIMKYRRKHNMVRGFYPRRRYFQRLWTLGRYSFINLIRNNYTGTK